MSKKRRRRRKPNNNNNNSLTDDSAQLDSNWSRRRRIEASRINHRTMRRWSRLRDCPRPMLEKLVNGVIRPAIDRVFAVRRAYAKARQTVGDYTAAGIFDLDRIGLA